MEYKTIYNLTISKTNNSNYGYFTPGNLVINNTHPNTNSYLTVGGYDKNGQINITTDSEESLKNQFLFELGLVNIDNYDFSTLRINVKKQIVLEGEKFDSELTRNEDLEKIFLGSLDIKELIAKNKEDYQVYLKLKAKFDDNNGFLYQGR